MKTLLFLFVLLNSMILFSQEEILISSVSVDCGEDANCIELESSIKSLTGANLSIINLDIIIGKLVKSKSLYRPVYRLVEVEGKIELEFSVGLRTTISDIVISSPMPEVHNLIGLPIHVGDPVFEDDVERTKEKVQSFLADKGYPNAQIKVSSKQESVTSVKYFIDIDYSKPLILKSVQVVGVTGLYNKIVTQKFDQMLKRPFDLEVVKKLSDESRIYFNSFGHLLSTINYEFSPYKDGLGLTLNVDAGPLFVTTIKGAITLQPETLFSLYRFEIKKLSRVMTKDEIRGILHTAYRDKGFLNTKIDVKFSEYKNADGVKYFQTDISINEQKRTKIKSVIFSGNNKYSSPALRKMFYEGDSDLISKNYFDPIYVTNFSERLIQRYQRAGFLLSSASVSEILDDDGNVTLDYKIIENNQTIIKGIKFGGIPRNYEDDLAALLYYKLDSPFNPSLLEKQVKRLTMYLQAQGYYYAKLSTSLTKVLKYNLTGTQLELNFNFHLGPKLFFKNHIVAGNIITKKLIIDRKVKLSVGELLTREKVELLQESLMALGLFSSVKIEPIVVPNVKEQLSELLITLKERDYGAFEIAPGYRTDIGLKLSTKFSYLNIMGMNRSLTLLGQVNQRLYFTTLDQRRRNEGKKLIEYSTRLNYTESDIFGSGVDYSAAIVWEKKRFYSFDAQILRNGHTISKQLTSKMSGSFRYQYETISQFDATSSRDEGTFQIGAITPGITYDLRNSRINPRKGAFFNASVEFADPKLLSQNTEDLVINYYKFVSRNRFYIPLGKYGVLATYVAWGMESNLARHGRSDSNGNSVVDSNGKPLTQGYIPSIKVFRLAGTDIVRGFDETEINRLKSGQDISEYTVQRQAYMTNIKIEPRFFLKDDTILGFFFDAGRVDVDHFNPTDLRSSVGISFKYLTPVGSLDFDYGIKLLRKDLGGGRYESPGRLHISIGFF